MTPGIARYRQTKSWFGLEKRVRENYLVDELHVWILGEFRIDVEEHWHVDLFMRVEHLFLEAEALYLIKVLPDVERQNIVRGYPYDLMIGRICGRVKRQSRLPGNNRDLPLLRLEVPLHRRRHIRVELDFDPSVSDRRHRDHLTGVVAS